MATVLRPFLQPESPLSPHEFGLRRQVQALGVELNSLFLGVANSYTIYHPMLLIDIPVSHLVLSHSPV